MSTPRWIDAEEIYRRVSPEAARRALLDALLGGLDPANDPPRSNPDAGNGHLLIMPSSSANSAGVKVLSVAPDNPDRGLPRIQAWYVLMDAETLTPSVLLDGTALTVLRTPAHSMIGVDALAPAQVETAVFIGGGPQTVNHARALLEVRTPGRALVHDRAAERAQGAAAKLVEMGIDAQAIGADELSEAIAQADLIICCTSSAEPLFDGSLVRPGACVVAMGSHEPDRRELDSGLMARSQVVVEDIATALREPGDVVIPVAEGVLDPATLRTVLELVQGKVTPATDRPNIFKTVGMSWQDLVVAEAAAAAD